MQQKSFHTLEYTAVHRPTTQVQGSKLTWTVDRPETVPNYNPECQKFCPKILSGNIAHKKVLFHGGLQSVQTMDFHRPQVNFYSYRNGVNFKPWSLDTTRMLMSLWGQVIWAFSNFYLHILVASTILVLILSTTEIVVEVYCHRYVSHVEV